MTNSTNTSSAAGTSAGTKKPKSRKQEKRTVHFYVLLDRSGSMESMKSDVIGGFNGFLTEQLAGEGRARLTLVQFDSQDLHDVVHDAAPLRHVSELTPTTFVPRGGTPLLDATAKIIEDILGRREGRKVVGKSAEEIVVITITDGEENQSRSHNLTSVRALVEAGKKDGWSFVFLGAGIDAYADAQRLGYDEGSIQAWKADGEGAKAMWGSVSRAAAQLRRDVAANAAFSKAEYFRGMKEAEDDTK